MLFRSRFWTVRRYEYLKYYYSLLDRISKNSVSSMAQRALYNTYILYEQMRKKTILGKCAHHSGPCIPGVVRLFVNVNGDLYPCPNVSELKEYFKIGSLDTGFQLEKMRRLLNNGEITANDCIDCWNLPLCNMCSQNIRFEGEEISREDKRVSCANQKNIAMNYLTILAVLREFGCDVQQMGGY